ncbi:MAG TPA: site-specific integrase, partial [Methylophilus sp.]
THDEDKSKLKWLDTFLGDLYLDEINLEVIRQIKNAKLKEASKSTVNRYLALLRSILRRARDEWEWIDKAPKVRLFQESNERVRALTVSQAKILLSELPEHQRMTVLFALATGLRQSNIIKMEWSQIDLENHFAYVNAGDFKNRKAHGIPLNDAALQVLQCQFKRHHTRVFTYKGEPFSSANTAAWKKALKRAGIENFRWHDLRHTWATWLRKAGTPTHELQRLGGWKTLAMVERYAHIQPDDLEYAASRLNAVFVGYDLVTPK